MNCVSLYKLLIIMHAVFYSGYYNNQGFKLVYHYNKLLIIMHAVFIQDIVIVKVSNLCIIIIYNKN